MTPRLHQLLFALGLVLATPLNAASLTDMETRWIKAGMPVINHARELKLPLDIIVQPEAGPNDVPLAMGFANGRCKLVLSMRGNPAAESILDGVPEAGRAVLIEAMTAHELAHCWRYAQGVWHALPAGFIEVGELNAPSQALLDAARAMRETRREEGYADLAALAWTQLHHPARYAQVHAWLAGVRSRQPVAHNAHDTRTWVSLAADATVFEHSVAVADRSAPVFAQVRTLWQRGLLNDD
jgi:hypothetical protein